MQENEPTPRHKRNVIGIIFAVFGLTFMFVRPEIQLWNIPVGAYVALVGSGVVDLDHVLSLVSVRRKTPKP